MRSTALFFILTGIMVTMIFSCHQQKSANTAEQKTPPVSWVAPDITKLGNSPEEELIKYGKELVVQTAMYIGPKGKISKKANGMNCQNCHLDAGTKPFGNNYSAVASLYPKFRERSGRVESIYQRVNDCIERSLNGKALDTTGTEMQAIKAYIEWVGKDVKKGVKPAEAGISELAFLNRAADTIRGQNIYVSRCKLCHGPIGEGQRSMDSISYLYPPLWGAHSYTSGAGLYRLSRVAGYVRCNMPFGASYTTPQLTEEEAWDVAAFVCAQQRPSFDLKKDWPDISTKPIDYPFGSYADTFPKQQHKFGPFAPIVEYKKQHGKK